MLTTCGNKIHKSSCRYTKWGNTNGAKLGKYHNDEMI